MQAVAVVILQTAAGRSVGIAAGIGERSGQARERIDDDVAFAVDNPCQGRAHRSLMITPITDDGLEAGSIHHGPVKLTCLSQALMGGNLVFPVQDPACGQTSQQGVLPTEMPSPEPWLGAGSNETMQLHDLALGQLTEKFSHRLHPLRPYHQAGTGFNPLQNFIQLRAPGQSRIGRKHHGVKVPAGLIWPALPHPKGLESRLNAGGFFQDSDGAVAPARRRQIHHINPLGALNPRLPFEGQNPADTQIARLMGRQAYARQEQLPETVAPLQPNRIIFLENPAIVRIRCDQA